MLIHDHNNDGRALGVIALMLVLLTVGLMGMTDPARPLAEETEQVAQAGRLQPGIGAVGTTGRKD